MLQKKQVDGIISSAHNRGIEEYDILKLPVVGIDRYLSSKTPVVSSDNYDGGKQVTQLLLNKGCKHVIHINGPDLLETPANLRRRAYEDIMKANQLIPLTYEFLYRATQETVQDIVKKIFDENPKVDGIFASDDLIAFKVIIEAKKRKINIPADLKVVGYDGTETTRLLLPELSTVEQPIKEIAEKAVGILIKQINGQHDDIQLETILPVKLIDSETT